MLRKRIILIIFSVFFYSVASGTNYYVSSTVGNDALDGKSQANAWKTISKVNSKTFLPGDSILFKKGDVWRETLTVPSSGNTGSYIVFASYGFGVNPRILGSKATTWADQGGNIWKSVDTFTDPTAESEIFFEGTGGSVSWGKNTANLSGLTAEYNWTWSSNYIYVYAISNPGSRYVSVEVPQRASIISLNDKQYLDFNGIDLFYAKRSGFTYNAYPMKDNNGLIIERLKIAFIGSKYLENGFGSEVVYSDMIVRYDTIHDCGRRGVGLNLYGNAFTAENILIEGNVLYNGSHTTGVDINVGSSGCTGSLNNITVRKNLIYDSPTSALSSELMFIQNYHTGSSALTNVYIYDNMFKYTNMAGIHLENVEKIFIYNNIFYGHNTAGSSNTFQVHVSLGSFGIVVKNNIFYTLLNNDTNYSGLSIYCTPDIDHSQIDVDYNIHYRINNSLKLLDANGTNYYMNNISTVRSVLGWETHGQFISPAFISASDYHVQGGSPAIGAGIAIPEVTTDFEGNAFTDPPNIGCYATPITTAVPTFFSASVENATPSLLEISFNKTLANIIPATSAFNVLVNSVSRAVSSVVITGSKVQLTLSSAVTYGDIVSVAYTKPSLNPIQSTTGAAADSFTAQTVTNNVSSAIPVYVSSVIDNATPTLLGITYNIPLANIVPATTAFTVLVNSVNRTVTSVTISGTLVRLTLASAVSGGDVVTVAYTKPATNPLQTSSGGQAAGFTAKSVTNNVNATIPTYVSAVIENIAPSLLVVTYNLALANITPPTSSFIVSVNSAPRTINSIVINGNKVQLTLATAVVFGDLVTVSYTKPASNPIQTPSGGQAANLIAVSVTNNVSPSSPIYLSSVIENANPNVLAMTYQLTLANITPGASAFTVTVNSATRTINSVSINGTKVNLTLQSPVNYGDLVTVAYSKPAVNPLQTPSGGQASTLSATSVTNNVSPSSPEYISSVVENGTPSLLSLSFSQSLANITPDVSAFTVLVNSTSRNVTSIIINGSLVTLTLAGPIVNSDQVTVAYTKPGVNPLQSSSGGLVSTFTSKTVSNNVGVVNSPPEIQLSYSDTCTSGFIGEIDASGSTDKNNDILSYSWVKPGQIDISSTTSPKIQFLAPIESTSETFNFTLNVSDGKATTSENFSVTVIPYKPELSQSVITKVVSGSYLGTDLPTNIADGNTETYWSADGDNQWLTCRLKDPFSIDHLKLSFSKEDIGGSFFDILASRDSLQWDPLLTNATSCGFSTNLQIFSSQGSGSTAYTFIKLIGHGNSLNSLNKISELQAYGGSVYPSSEFSIIGITVYPNPAQDIINIFFKESVQDPQILRIVTYSGNIVYESRVESGTNYLQIPITFSSGSYVVHLISNGIIKGVSKLLVK